jgi:hypothetical protein
MWRRSFPNWNARRRVGGPAQLCEVTSGGDDETEVEPDPLADDVLLDADPDELDDVAVPVVPAVLVVVVCDTTAAPLLPSTGSWPSRIWR